MIQSEIIACLRSSNSNASFQRILVSLRHLASLIDLFQSFSISEISIQGSDLNKAVSDPHGVFLKLQFFHDAFRKCRKVLIELILLRKCQLFLLEEEGSIISLIGGPTIQGFDRVECLLGSSNLNLNALLGCLEKKGSTDFLERCELLIRDYVLTIQSHRS